MARITPTPTPTSQPYWDGCTAGELRLQTCNACRHVQFYPRIVCSQCHSEDLSWQVASGQGRVASFTIMRHAVSDAYPTSQVIALVDLAEGPRMMTHIVGSNAETVSIDAEVTVTFENWNTDTAVPVFTLYQHDTRS